MEKKFNHALNGIRTLMGPELESIRKSGKQADKKTVDEFGEKIRNEIIVFKRAVVELRQEISDERTIERLMHRKLDELLEIMKSPDPEAVKAGHFVSVEKPTDPANFWAYHDLYELSDWIQESCRYDPSKPVILTQASETFARRKFDDLPAVEDELRTRGVSEQLVETLMQPFRRLQSSRTSGLTHLELVNLRKLRTGILDCHKLADKNLETSLYTLLYELNVNTFEAAKFCKAHLQEQLDQTDTVTDRRLLLARFERALKQVTINQPLLFAPWRHHSLREEILQHIKDELEYLEKTTEPFEPVTHLRIDPNATLISINMPNEHYAACIRVQHECGYYLGTKKDTIKLTGRQIVSSKNKPLGSTTFEDNFNKPTNAAVKAKWKMSLKEIVWMSKTWGRDHDIPNVLNMNEREWKNLISGLA